MRQLRVCGRSLVTARRAVSPVDNLGLVDDETMILVRRQTGRIPNCAVDVYKAVTASADQMMVVIVHTVFIAGGKARRLNAANKSLVDHEAEGVVNRLAGYGSDAGANGGGEFISRRMRMRRHGAQYCESLGCYLNPLLSQELFDIFGHSVNFAPILDLVKYLDSSELLQNRFVSPVSTLRPGLWIQGGNLRTPRQP